MPTSEDHALYYQLMFSENKAVTLLIDPNGGTIIDASLGACQYYGYSLSELTAMSIFDINTMSKAEIAAEMQRAKEKFKTHFDFRHRLASGEVRDVEVYSNPIPMDGQKFLYSVIHDITARKQVEEALKEAVASQNAILAAIPDLMFELDQRGRYLNLWARNPNELACSKAELLGRTVSEMLPTDAADQVMSALREADEKGQSHGQQIQLTTADGELWFELSTSLKDGVSSPHRFIMLSHNITKRKHMEAKLRYLSFHDPLTGLYNRNVLEQQLNDEIHRAVRYNHALSIFMLDIDHFKPINDTYGHGIGDTVLRSFATVLESSIRKTDYATRYGGEEFVVILPETSPPKAEELAERLRNQVAEYSIPIEDDEELNITTSIGVSTFPEHGKSWEDLLNAADSAMYAAKDGGRNCVRVAKNTI
ncbi:MAG: sensor domain-containing diguanylate cyclase [Gammaproteobacteria bacterium]|nr:sensor domain-containing diguanylate cyclase [Gammaproteobacteria bacterium]